VDKYTVVGFWNEEDKRHVVGVIKGEHDVRGGEDVYDAGLFAELVEADSYEDAESQVHGTTEEDEEDDDDFPDAPDLSDKFTIRNNPDPQMDQQFQYDEVLKLPPHQVWTVVEGDSGRLWALTGVHFVNRLHFAVTEEPWTEEDESIDYKW
jgi:hypothetical protein